MPSKANTSQLSTPKDTKRNAVASRKSPGINCTIPKSAPAKIVSSQLTTKRSNPYKVRYLNPDLDVNQLFDLINADLFDNKIKMTSIRWSMRMTSTVGLTTYRGKNAAVDIALSKPILSLRPLVDTVETLIHEMIHAFIFTVYGWKAEKAQHGPKYLAMEKEINEKTGLNISVHHDFNDVADFLNTARGKHYLADLKDL